VGLRRSTHPKDLPQGKPAVKLHSALAIALSLSTASAWAADPAGGTR